MKLTEFINLYNNPEGIPICPACGGGMDVVLRVNLSHSIYYRLVDVAAPLIPGGDKWMFIYRKEKNIEIQNNYHASNCTDCVYSPHVIPATDSIRFDFLQPNAAAPVYGQADIKLECVKNDFNCTSTMFSVFSNGEQTIDRSKDAIEIQWDRLVYNDYEAGTTTIKMVNLKERATKTIKLVPIDKWLVGDKNKMKEKLDSLLVLI